jgi:hypothetical protein
LSATPTCDAVDTSREAAFESRGIIWVMGGVASMNGVVVGLRTVEDIVVNVNLER